MNQSVRAVFKDKKVCVVVPTYNNARTLPDVLSSILAFTDQVIVVIDGSTDNTKAIMEDFPEVQWHGYKNNCGKGYAIRTGFEKALELGYHYAITIDSDGQHFADDLPKFLTALNEHQRAIIIGARNMDQASVPGKSSFGNKFSNFWFWVETGISRSDTQSGYRLYPVQALRDMRFFTRKYEFEIEVIVRAAWAGIEVIEVPVKVFYPEKEKRISHFRPFRDFSRISVLNTVLVAITFLYIKPRNFFRSFKKKISGRTSATFFSTRMRPTVSKQFQ
jgi:glycosyltransferase involved in cell wall biosynthesis